MFHEKKIGEYPWLPCFWLSGSKSMGKSSHGWHAIWCTPQCYKWIGCSFKYICLKWRKHVLLPFIVVNIPHLSWNNSQSVISGVWSKSSVPLTIYAWNKDEEIHFINFCKHVAPGSLRCWKLGGNHRLIKWYLHYQKNIVFLIFFGAVKREEIGPKQISILKQIQLSQIIWLEKYSQENQCAICELT